MQLSELGRTSVVKLAVRYTLFYGAILTALLIVLHWSSSRFVSEEMEEEIEQELLRLAEIHAKGGAAVLQRDIDARLEDAIHSGRFYLFAGSDGQPISGNLTKWPHEANVLLGVEVEVENIWLDDDILIGNYYTNDAYLPAAALRLRDGSRLLVARGVEQHDALRELSENLFESLPAVVFFVLLVGISMGWSILRRLEAIQLTAHDIMAGDLSRRIPVSDKNDEFDALARCLNEMLARIEDVLTEMREVTDNVAHDLRNPISRIRNRMEVTLLERRSEEDYREAMYQTIRDAEAMMRTFNAILHIAQANAGMVRARLEKVDLVELARQLGELYEPIAEEAGLSLQVQADGMHEIRGHPDLLGQAVVNLLDNAVKYTPRGGRIMLAVQTHTKGIDLIVADTGPGIPESEYQRVKQRFVRLGCDRPDAGSGLGLSLVDAIARQHQGMLLFADNHPGLRAIIRLPLPRGSLETHVPVTHPDDRSDAGLSQV